MDGSMEFLREDALRRIGDAHLSLQYSVESSGLGIISELRMCSGNAERIDCSMYTRQIRPLIQIHCALGKVAHRYFHTVQHVSGGTCSSLQRLLIDEKEMHSE